MQTCFIDQKISLSDWDAYQIQHIAQGNKIYRKCYTKGKNIIIKEGNFKTIFKNQSILHKSIEILIRLNFPFHSLIIHHEADTLLSHKRYSWRRGASIFRLQRHIQDQQLDEAIHSLRNRAQILKWEGTILGHYPPPTLPPPIPWEVVGGGAGEAA